MRIQCPVVLWRSNGESSANEGVSSSMLQEVGVSPTLVILCLRAVNGHSIPRIVGLCY